ncbi:MAG: polysaccharide biosynthesis protein [Clostridia bacterium]|nr:polysaccharide biosynthesis protein [Clostridia bacterium]
MRRDSFVVGSLVLVAASLLGRALGATYRIAVPLLVGRGTEKAAVVMGLYGMAAPVYGVLLSAAATGLPVALARVVSARVSLGRGREAEAVLRTALLLVLAVGGAAALGLFLLAPWYAERIARDARAAPAVAAVAPAVLVVSLGAVLRGFLQGLRLMTPYAVSQVTEQLVRVAAILALVVLFVPCGVEWAAAGASLGATIGGLASLAYLFARLGPARELARSGTQPAGGPGDPVAAAGPPPPKGAPWLELVWLAVPISLSYMVLPMVNFVDALVVPSRLHAAGLGERATALFGYLTGFAMPFMVLPTTITAALAMNLVPAVSEREARRDDAGVKAHLALAVRLALFVSLPAAFGLFALATPIESVVLGAPAAGPILATLAPGVVMVAVQQVTAACLQGLGRPAVPMWTLFLGGSVKLALTYVLAGDPALNVRGAALGTVAAFLVAAGLNASVLAWLGYRLPWGRLVLGPLVASAGMALLAAWAEAAARTGVGAAGPLGEALALALAIVVGLVSYAYFAAWTGAVRAEEVEALPKVGRRVRRLGERLRLWRA